MLARVVETIYWMARHIERTENLARLINVNSHLLLDLPKGITPEWEPLIHITGAQEDFLERYDDFTERAVISYLVNQKENPSCLLNSIAQARENARTIRDVIPREYWEQLNALFLYAKENSQKALAKTYRFEFFNGIILRCQTLNGLLSGTMNHDAGYSFLLIGRSLERADMTSRIIDVRSANLLEGENKSLDSFETVQWMLSLIHISEPTRPY